MNYLKITEEVCIKLQNISNEFILKRSKKLNKNSFTKKDIHKINCKSKIESLEFILKLSYKILEKSNIKNYSKDTFLLEFQKRNSGFEDKEYNYFRWHKDDYAAISYNVYTVIFYIRKDKTLKGGNFLYRYNYDSEIISKEIEERDVLCFKGDILHFPETVKGFGCRDIIVVFFKRL